ncbi:hypothetical protein JTE90_025166 [Oedothorax gibbosus]|uniref:Rubicon Homology domain-containing protein n=1 Tax=Oedothorax gibbosus TaxID=931172 RepID=A0AAV6UGL5_9ARAC|nr:hypothetical protein JTE90_025166 [Oedothorax gibbosus]
MNRQISNNEVEDSFNYSKTIINSIGVPCCYPTVGDVDDDECYRPALSTSVEISQEIDAELGLSENHFSRPEGYFGFSTSEELKMAIGNCEEMIKSDVDYTRKKHLVAKLVQLKLKLQEIQRPAYKPLPEWYHCINCGFKCHSKCLNLITRICASTKVLDKCSYELSICPVLGLSQQKFRCAECKRKFIFKNDMCLPRLCDYSGLFYCSYCHWNSVSIIPSRVIHNWDFEPQKVCRASLQYLRLMVKKPILNLESLNPTLFALVTDLGQIKKLREDILLMKQYFVTCHIAQDQKLLLLLRDRQHFVEGATIYSLQDLIDASSGKLLEYLEGVVEAFTLHITKECQGCRGKGFICELCKSEDVIFPFEPRTDVCQTCSSLFHQDCHLRWKGPCPKCARKGRVPSAASDQS